MRPLYLAPGTTAPPRTLGVDGDARGCAALYSHWPGHPAPRAIAADLATAILLRASRDPERWLAGFEYCANDHLDVDGLLAMTLACRPELAVRWGPTMLGAAGYGDFCHWPGPEATRLALRLHQLLRDEGARGPGWQQRCVERVVDDFLDLAEEAQRHDEEREAQLALILEGRARLEAGGDDSLVLHAIDGAPLHAIHVRHRHGHHPDGPTTVAQADDCPPWVLHGFVPAAHSQLLCLHDEQGTRYQLDAPRHSWAHTVHLPAVAWPDCSALAAELARSERDGVRWVGGSAARERGFTCLLASCDAGGTAAPSQLPAATVSARIAALLGPAVA